MTNLLQTGAAWLTVQRQAAMTSEVLYSRGAAQVPLAATIGRTVFRTQDFEGFLQYVESRDFLVRAADLVIAGESITPIAGDQVRQRVGAAVYVYEVISPTGEPPWRWSDQYNAVMRVHTKQIAIE